MRFRPRRPAHENAARVLPRLLAKFFRDGDEVALNRRRLEEVHPFRILTKRFRYVLEYFQSCYGAAIESHIKSIKNLQQVLGQITDCSSTRTLLAILLYAGKNAKYQKLHGALERHEAELLTAFQEQWKTSFTSASRRRQLGRYLANPRRVRAPRGRTRPGRAVRRNIGARRR